MGFGARDPNHHWALLGASPPQKELNLQVPCTARQHLPQVGQPGDLEDSVSRASSGHQWGMGGCQSQHCYPPRVASGSAETKAGPQVKESPFSSPFPQPHAILSPPSMCAHAGPPSMECPSAHPTLGLPWASWVPPVPLDPGNDWPGPIQSSLRPCWGASLRGFHITSGPIPRPQSVYLAVE